MQKKIVWREQLLLEGNVMDGYENWKWEPRFEMQKDIESFSLFFLLVLKKKEKEREGRVVGKEN